MKIVFIQTGGTIDKDYPRTQKGYAFEIGKPAVERILQRVHPNFDFQIVSLLRKDSLDITKQDREKILEACRKADADKIVVTHGTDTMIETAKRLSDIKDKVMILTGALRPERFSDSDALFNVGTAIGAINVLTNGVYIAMSGRIYPWNEVRRDRKTGRFVES
ncbi:MAG TPA: asparaginase domain-containing protein [Candidatus Bathyarchaeia archaeon]|nr:asparaginase domain-containing protein [Candidatus Bathyarchaeia archaeon]